MLRFLLTSLGKFAAAAFCTTFIFTIPSVMASEDKLVGLLPKSDPIRQAARSMGFLLQIVHPDQFSGGWERPTCPLLLMSRTVAMQGQCSFLGPPSNEYAIQLPGIEHVSHKGSKYPVGKRAAERSEWNDWSVWNVQGDPSRHFGTARLSTSRPRVGTELFVLYTRKRQGGDDSVEDIVYRSDCRVSDIKAENSVYFTYVCGDPGDGYGKERGADFVFLKSDASFVGIQQFERPDRQFDVALPISELKKKSRLVSTIPAKRPIAEIDAATLKGLTCASAAALIVDPARMSELSWNAHDKVVAFIHACAAQVSMNKWKAPVDREIVVIRPDVVEDDGTTTFALERVKKDDRPKLINACWAAGDQSKQELLSTFRPKDEKGESRFDWKKTIGCAGISNAFANNTPFMIDALTSQEMADIRKFFDAQSQPDLGKSVVTAWEFTQQVVNLKPESHSPTSDSTVQVGIIKEHCLFIWDEPPQLHSTELVLRWNYQRLTTRMKKLRHCVKLTAVGPVDVKGIANEFVSECIDKALNDDKALHIFKGLIAVAVDIGSAGATGGSATFAAATDYALAVKDRAISCLTDEKKIEEFLATRAGAKIDASVGNESHWIYWNL